MLVRPRKKRVLAWADSAAAGTGFGTVSKHILGALHATGEYEIDHLAINFHGDFHDKSVIPWQQQPARLWDPKDPHGVKMFARTIGKTRYDIVWICNDLYVTHKAAEFINKIRKEYVTANVKPPIFIYYYPVDCSVPNDRSEFLKAVDIPVCYTQHGKEETLKTFPELQNRLLEIPHGVDTTNFKPVAPDKITKLKEQFFHVTSDTTVVLNVNRNSVRKQLQYSILAFKEFRKKVPDSIMYMHTSIKDVGGDLIRAVHDLGMTTKDIVFPLRFSPSNPAPVHILGALYNASDIFLTTHLGEGWGLTVTEAMAAGVPVVAPTNTSMPQQLGQNSSRGYLYPCTDTICVDLSGFRPKGLIPDIVDKMLEAHNDGPKWNNNKVTKARQWAVKHDWSKITQKWIDLFGKASEMSTIAKTPIIGEEV